MPVTKEDLVGKLAAAGVQFTTHDHPAVMTAEAQAQALSGVPGAVTKNLFLKDKKHRLYIITALMDTKVDLKVLSARLGVGRGGMSMASEELLQAVLQVPLGSVTPLAIANANAAQVILLLDNKIQSQEAVFVHPLVNTTSLALSPSAFDAAIRALGREPVYVDLEADPKIDKDNPPDLKHISDAAEPSAAAVAAATAADAPAATASPAPSAAPAKAASSSSASSSKASKKDTKTPAKAAPQSSTAILQQATDVQAITEDVLNKLSTALLGKPISEAQLDPYALARLRADVESELCAMKNASYSLGFTAGKGAVVAYAERKFA